MSQHDFIEFRIKFNAIFSCIKKNLQYNLKYFIMFKLACKFGTIRFEFNSYSRESKRFDSIQLDKGCSPFDTTNASFEINQSGKGNLQIDQLKNALKHL